MDKTVNKIPVFRYMMADYLNVGTEETPDIQLMSTFETIDESPAAQVTKKHYTANKSETSIVTGYSTSFPISTDMYQNDKVTTYLRDIGEEQKLGVSTDYYRVRLYEPIEGKENTFYARHFKVGFEISSIKGGGGELVAVDGNMNATSDAVIGEFNTVTRKFTHLSDVTEAPVE